MPALSWTSRPTTRQPPPRTDRSNTTLLPGAAGANRATRAEPRTGAAGSVPGCAMGGSTSTVTRTSCRRRWSAEAGELVASSCKDAVINRTVTTLQADRAQRRFRLRQGFVGRGDGCMGPPETVGTGGARGLVVTQLWMSCQCGPPRRGPPVIGRRCPGPRRSGLARPRDSRGPAGRRTLDPVMSAVAETPARTYEVRTYGCQMNVHDSERLTGLLEDAGYVARARRTSRPTCVVFNTCAVRENADNKLYGNLGHLAPVKAAATRACRSPSAAAWRRRTAPRSPTKAPWVDVVFGTHNIGSLPVLLERARVQEEAQVEILESLEVFPSTLPTRRESAYAAWVSISRRAATTPARSASSRRCAARRRTAGPATSSPRSRRWSPRASARSPCSGRTSTPTAWSSATARRSPSCCAPAATIEGLERVRFTSPAPGGVHRRRDRGDGRDAQRDAAAAHAAAVRLRPGAARRCAAPTGRRSTSASSSGSAPRCPTPRSPPTSSSASPARPRRTSRRPSTSCARRASPAAFTFQYSKRPGTPAATMHDQVPQGGRPGALRAAGRRWSTRSPGRRTRRSSAARVELLVAEGEGRKDAATHRLSGRARDNRLVHFAAGRRRGRASRARRHGRRSRSPTPPRTTWSPTARSCRSAVPAPATPGRPAPPRSRPASRSACRRSAYPRPPVHADCGDSSSPGGCESPRRHRGHVLIRPIQPRRFNSSPSTRAVRQGRPTA